MEKLAALGREDPALPVISAVSDRSSEEKNLGSLCVLRNSVGDGTDLCRWETSLIFVMPDSLRFYFLRTIGRFAPAGLLFCLAATAEGASSSPLWRYWDREDGFSETGAESIAEGPHNTIWVKHGGMISMSMLDGYSVNQVPDPQVERRVYGTWGATSEGIIHYQNGRWALHPYRSLVAATGRDENVAFAITPDLFFSFSASDGAFQAIKRAADTKLGHFLSIGRYNAGALWVVGENGLGRLLESGSAASPTWVEFTNLEIGLSDLKNPITGFNGEFFIGGNSLKSGKPAVMRFDGTRFQLIAEGHVDGMRGWPGPAGSIWIADGSNTYRFVRDGRGELIEPTGALIGSITDILPDKNGNFWVTTSQGVARYTSPLWVSPGGNPEINKRVHTIVEDKKGRLWFACAENIACLDHGAWRIYNLPGDQPLDRLNTNAICLLPGGELLVKPRQWSRPVLVFDPERETFRTLEHPQGRGLGTFARQRDGTILIQTFTEPAAATHHFQIEAFDGKNFRMVADITPKWRGAEAEIRFFFTASNGDLWLGGPSGLGMVHDGQYRDFTAADGYTSNGAFAVCELPDGKILTGGREKLLAYDGKAWSTVFDGIDRLRTIFFDHNGLLWVAAGSGIYRYHEGAWINNTIDDGLPSTIGATIFEDSQGHIWAGTETGMARYTPEVDTAAPRAFVPAQSNLSQVGSDGRINFMFSGVDEWKQTLAERLMFSWRVDDEKWSSFLATRTAAFEKLRPGQHRFEARAMDRAGNIGEPASLNFSVVRPVWQEPWFIALIALFTGAVVTQTTRVFVRERRLRKSNEALADEIEGHRRTEAALKEKTTRLELEIVERMRMEQEVKKTHAALMLASREAGMAEVATSVLHNVGNVLNSVTTSATLAVEKIKSFKIGSLVKVADLITGNTRTPDFLAADERGKKIPDYLKALSADLASGQQESTRELESLRQNIDHIKDIVSMQQNYARLGGISEQLKVSELVEDALRMNTAGLKAEGIKLVRDYQKDAVIEVDRHKVLQILVNVLGNAKQACKDSGRPDKEVIMRIRQGEGPERIEIQVIDNGVGIPPENLSKIFNHGFTTRKDGHG
jgi:signal transduction histidine kinase